MKTNKLIIGLTTILLPVLAGRAMAQQSAVIQDVIKIEAQTTDAQINNLTPSQKQTTISYMDGLGRPIQTVVQQNSPTQMDVVQPVVYDNLGRVTQNFLPYADASTGTGGVLPGSYRATAVTEQAAFYNNTSQYIVPVDAEPYMKKLFESSPLQRLLDVGDIGAGYQPGETGTQHYKTVVYRNNITSDGNIIIWNYDGTYTPGNYYGVNSLSVQVMTDEDNMEVITFTDKAGHLILKRKVNSGNNPDTYYLYNNAGLLQYVVPPDATHKIVAGETLTSADVVNGIFYYAYDGRGRLISKTVPGGVTLSIIYDPVNRPVLMQDPNLKANNQWSYIKYDSHNRPIAMGIYTDATIGHTTPSGMQTYVSGITGYNTYWFEARTATWPYYTNNVFPTTSVQDLAYNIYDDYDLDQDGHPDFSFNGQGFTDVAATYLTQGKLTITFKNTLGPDVSGNWLTKVVFYDKRDNTIEVQSNNLLNYMGKLMLPDIKTSDPAFTGITQKTLVTQVTVAAGVTNTNKILTNYTYDANQRILDIDQTYNTQAPVRIANYRYNEAGQLVARQLAQISGGNYLQNVACRYNIRGQVISINNSRLISDGGVTSNTTTALFGMILRYDQVDGNLHNTPSYSGKLTAVKWMTRDASDNPTNERSYVYSYNNSLDRYTGATYGERTSSTGAFSTNADGFDETVGYDRNGNVTSLVRNSSTMGASSYQQVDNLTYTYDTKYLTNLIK